MTEGEAHGEPFGNLLWFKEQLKHGFDRLAHTRKYSDGQFRKLEHALIHLEPVPDELDDLLVNLGVFPE